MSRLNADDSGVYSCRAVNPYGSINASFAVQVLGTHNFFLFLFSSPTTTTTTSFNSIITLAFSSLSICKLSLSLFPFSVAPYNIIQLPRAPAKLHPLGVAEGELRIQFLNFARFPFGGSAATCHRRANLLVN